MRLADTLQLTDHIPDPNCLCDSCIKNGDIIECKNLHNCYKHAEKLVHLLPAKWNPKMKPLQEENIIVDNSNDPDMFRREYFDSKLETDGTIADAFRAFTNGDTMTIYLGKERMNTTPKL